MPLQKEAIGIFEQFLENIPKLESKLLFDNSPPMGRLKNSKQNIGTLDKYKDFELPYEDIANFTFITNEYMRATEVCIADVNNKEKYKDLYIFENHENPDRFINKYDFLSKIKASSIFKNPKRRNFDTDSMKFVLNMDFQDVYAFSRYLIYLAHDMRKIDEKNVSYDVPKSLIYKLSRIFCLGPQGIGKTTFLNYLFSIYSIDFYKNKVIWIRLDFNEQRLRGGESLENTILSYFIRILVKKYLNNEETKIIIDWERFRRHLTLKAIPINEDYIINLKSFQTEMKVESQFDKKFIYELISFLRIDGYGFIFIIDGIDRLSLQKDDSKSFRDLSKDLKYTFFEQAFIKGVFILSMRYISYKYAREKNSNIWRKAFDNQMGFFLLAKNLEKIIKSKFLSARGKILHLGEKRGYAFIDDEFLDYFEDKVLKITLKGLEADPSSSFNDNFGIFGYNFRLVFRCMSRVFQFFGPVIIDHVYRYGVGKKDSDLDDELEKKKYNVLKAYMMSDDIKKDYHSNYKYRLDNATGTLYYVRQGYGRALVPNLFNYIDIKSTLDCWAGNEIRTLLRLRCLDYFIKIGNTKLGDIVEFLIALGYTENIVYAELEELMFECLVVSERIDTPFRNDFTFLIRKGTDLRKQYNEILRISRLGTFLFHNIIEKLEYLSLIVNDIPLPQEIINKMKPTNYYRSGVTLNQNIIKELFNSLTFVHSYLKPIEDAEEEFIQKKINEKCLSRFEFYLKNRERFFPRISSKVKEKALSIIFERLNNAKEDFTRELNDII